MRDSDDAVRPSAEALRAATANGTGLKAVSAQLSSLVASLRDSRRQLVERSHSPAIAPDAGRSTGGGVPQERVDLAPGNFTAESSLAHEATSDAPAETARLRTRLAQVEAENRRLSSELAGTQEQAAELAIRLVVLSRLHASLDRDEVLAAIADVLVNVVGAEELAVLERSNRTRLVPTFSLGVPVDRLDEVAIGQGAIGRAAETATVLLNAPPERPGESGLAACVPLVLGEEVTGVVVIYRLVGHKRLLRAADQGVLDLLGQHAAIALRCAGAPGPGRAEAGG